MPVEKHFDTPFISPLALREKQPKAIKNAGPLNVRAGVYCLSAIVLLHT
jgi:hypothetical protein